MVAAPLFGYLGDRFNRLYLMSFGVTLWSVTTLAGSFMPVSPFFFQSITSQSQLCFQINSVQVLVKLANFILDFPKRTLNLTKYEINLSISEKCVQINYNK